MVRFRRFRIVQLLLAIVTVGLLLVGEMPAPGPVGAASPAELPAILLKARTVTPEPGLDVATEPALLAAEAETAAKGDGFHVLIQLDHVPDLDEKAALARHGIHLQAYIPHQAWVARIDPAQAGPLRSLAGQHSITWIGALLPADKLDPALAEYLAGPPDPEFGDQIAVGVQFHADVSLDAGRELLEKYSARITGEASAINLLMAELDRADVPALSQEDEVLWLELPMPALTPTNANTRNRTHVDNIQNVAPYNLSGNGITVLVFDVGRASHPDYNGRIVDQDSTKIADHSSHVAGTLLGNGAGSTSSVLNNRGMAPNANLITYGYEDDGKNLFLYDNTGDIQADFRKALKKGADIATVSLGTNLASNGRTRINAGQPVGVFNCNREGDYNTTSQLLDNIVRGSLGSPLITTWANGNERSDGRCGNQFNTTAPPANAKNPIHVGATNRNNDNSANFSGWGPTDDGRLKPIVSAPGVNVLSTIPNLLIDDVNRNCINNPTNPNNGDDYCWPYDTMSGTSMATPAVAGIAALMLEQFHNSYNTTNNLLPATVKAILMNTAVDPNAAAAPGPDFQTGYGRVDAQAAVDTIRENRFVEGTLTSNGEVHRYYINIPVTNILPLRVSLAWDDAAGTALAATGLVNDLDLRLIEPGGGTTWQPWVLNPAQPNNAPVRGNDNRNNQEQVTVANPTAGWWTIEVRGTTLPQAPQTYGLAASHNPWSFNIRYPLTTAVANAGWFNGPSTFLVRLDVSDGYRPSTNLATQLSSSASLGLFVGGRQVSGSHGGDVIYRGPVGNEYHLVIRPPGQAAAGRYDFAVNFTGALTQTESNAVEYTNSATPPKAMSIVIDTSGSMSDDNKMEAARNSGRTFVYMSEIGDGVSITKFNTNASLVQALLTVNAAGDRAAMAGNITPLSAGGWTAIGQGLQMGYDQIKADARSRYIALLSDGKENQAPLWNNMKKNIPVGVLVDTVAFGPHADQALMAKIANRHNGQFHYVPTGVGSTTASSTTAVHTPAGTTATTADVSIATRVENRLADVYQFISNHFRDYQRLFEAAGTLSSSATTTVNIPIDESTSFLVFTVNWADSGTSLSFDLERPDGTLVAGGDPDADIRTDSTSKRFRMTAPASGTWKMHLKNTGGISTEFLAVVEGPADTELHVFTPSLGQCRPTVPDKICISFSDKEGNIQGGFEFIYLQVNTRDGQRTLTDPDGDGVYCSDPMYFLEGASNVKVDAMGQNRAGVYVRRIQRQSFYCGDLNLPPVLLVNDMDDLQREGYFPVRDQYVAALDNLGVAYNVWNTAIDGSPSAEAMAQYEKVIWFTGDDQFNPSTGNGPLDGYEETQARKFLEAREGNVFALISQGYLSTFGLSAFGKEVLGADGYADDAAGTTMRGLRASPLGHEYGTHTYAPIYPPAADVVHPAPDAAVNLVDENEQPTALTHGYGRGCAAFFAFGLDGLPTSAFEDMLKRIVDWECSPVDIQTTATAQSVSLHYTETFTDTFTITNPLVGGLQVEINNGPTHVALLTDKIGGVPTLLAPYNVGDLPSPAAASTTAAGPLDPSRVVSRVCQIATGLGDCFTGGTYTQDQLLDNDVIIIWNDNPLADPNAVGDMLADFVDMGGTVLLGGNAVIAGELGGRWLAEDYSPLKSTGTPQGGANLGVVTDPTDPLFAGVTDIITSNHYDAVPTPDGQVHARWSDGEVLAASRSFQPGVGPQVIAINASFEDGDWGKDLDALVANALGILDESWRNPGWFSHVCSVTLPATEGDTIPPITFDNNASCPIVQGGVDWQVELQLDSNIAPPTSIHATNPPRYRGKLTIDSSAMGRSRVNVPLEMEVLCPAGDADCNLTINTVDLMKIAAYFGMTSFPAWADVDGDGDVDVDDLASAAANWRRTFP